MGFIMITIIAAITFIIISIDCSEKKVRMCCLNVGEPRIILQATNYITAAMKLCEA